MTEISSFWYTPKGYKGIGLMEILTINLGLIMGINSIYILII